MVFKKKHVLAKEAKLATFPFSISKICKTCQKNFNQKGNWIKHIKSIIKCVSAEKIGLPRECPTCEKIIEYDCFNDHYRNHLKMAKHKPNKFKAFLEKLEEKKRSIYYEECCYCKKKYPKKYLRQHKRVAHNIRIRPKYYLSSRAKLKKTIKTFSESNTEKWKEIMEIKRVKAWENYENNGRLEEICVIDKQIYSKNSKIEYKNYYFTDWRSGLNDYHYNKEMLISILFEKNIRSNILYETNNLHYKYNQTHIEKLEKVLFEKNIRSNILYETKINYFNMYFNDEIKDI